MLQKIENEAGGIAHIWEGVTENDTPDAAVVAGGSYTANVEGDFGSGSIEIKYGKAAGNEVSIDATNLTFTADGSYNIEVGAGVTLPVVTGGSSMEVTISLSPIPKA